VVGDHLDRSIQATARKLLLFGSAVDKYRRLTKVTPCVIAEGIHLVTHSNSILPSTVNLYHIDLRFSPEQTFRCDALAVLHLSNPLTGPGSVMMPNVVQHLQLLPSTPIRPFAVAVGLGSREGNLNTLIFSMLNIATCF
jgi:hypothetical protein